jgi:hypothetical protein
MRPASEIAKQLIELGVQHARRLAPPQRHLDVRDPVDHFAEDPVEAGDEVYPIRFARHGGAGAGAEISK